MQRLVVPVVVSLLSVVPALLPGGRELAAQTPTSTGAMEVTVSEGRLSVDVRDTPLVDVLRAIGKQAELELHLDGEFQTPVTATFTGQWLESGIRRLTQGHSSSFAYGSPSPGSPGRLTEVWIVEATPGRRPATKAEPTARERQMTRLRELARRSDDGAVAEMSGILAQDPDPVVRARAAVVLGRTANPRATPALTVALGDQYPSVRIEAVRGLRRVEGERAAEALVRVLLSDADPSVRKATASVLGTLRDPAAGTVLGTAMSADSDASVRRAAATAHRKWERVSQAPTGGP